MTLPSKPAAMAEPSSQNMDLDSLVLSFNWNYVLQKPNAGGLIFLLSPNPWRHNEWGSWNRVRELIFWSRANTNLYVRQLSLSPTGFFPSEPRLSNLISTQHTRKPLASTPLGFGPPILSELNMAFLLMMLIGSPSSISSFINLIYKLIYCIVKRKLEWSLLKSTKSSGM